MERQQKETVVSELKAQWVGVQSIVVADYRSLPVNTITGLRDEFRAAGCHYRVLKNTLVRIALKGTDAESLGAILKGPSVVMWSMESPTAPAKLAVKVAKAHEGKFTLKGGYFDGQVLDAKGVAALATMPGKPELQSSLLMTFMAPATEFVRLTNAVPMNFLYVLQARERALGNQA